jgi:hypothetical protein
MWGVWRRREENIKDGGSLETEEGDHKRCGECGDGGRRSEKMWGMWRRREEIRKMYVGSG